MSPLKLQLKSTVRGQVNLQGATPDRLADLDLPSIAAWPISVDGSDAALEQAFEISDGERDRWLVSGDLQRCDFLGAGMRDGQIVADGSVGDYLASRMRGGRVEVRGDAGNYAASSLHGGSVSIAGNAGRYAAANAPNQTRGMSGGELFISGNADQWLARRMRRGLVIVHGHVASGCATRMIAGTVVICGHIATPLGSSMARGTLLLLDPPQALLSEGIVGFTHPSPSRLSFLPLLLEHIAPKLPEQLSSQLCASEWLRSLGDRSELGLGEVLLRLPAGGSEADSISPS